MLYLSSQDFFDKASECICLSCEEELICAELMKNGDAEARQRIINSYITFVASFVRRHSGKNPSLQFIYRCLQALEKQVDSFDFLYERDQFIHTLSLVLRKEVTGKIIGP